MKLLPFLLMIAACSSTRAHHGPTVRLFDREIHQVVLRVPKSGDWDPARAANAPEVMVEFTAAAERYLKERKGDTLASRQVKGLLAAALLRQGRPMDALALTRNLRPPVETPQKRENLLARAGVAAVSACRVMEARRLFDRFLAGEVAAEDLLERHGALMGLDLPHPEADHYAERLEEAAATMRRDCRPELVNDPRAMARSVKRATAIRRVLSLQLYDDSAQLLRLLPPPDPLKTPQVGAESTYAQIACALFVIYGETLGDQLPEKIPGDRKQWIKEHLWSVYRRAKEVAGHFLAAPARARIDAGEAGASPDEELYAALVSAELSAMGWVETRD